MTEEWKHLALVLLRYRYLMQKGRFHSVLCPLSAGCVDTILVLSFVHACQHTKLVIYLSFFFKQKEIHIYDRMLCSNKKGTHMLVAFSYN